MAIVRNRPRVVALRVSTRDGIIKVSAYADLPMPPDVSKFTYRNDEEWVAEFGEQFVGYVSALSASHDQAIDMIRDKCERDLAALTKILHRKSLPLFIVHVSEVRPAFVRTGLGVEMYIEAAKAVAKKYRGALAPDYCAGGATSLSAKRVWKSRRMNEAVIRSGDVVYWKRKR